MGSVRYMGRSVLFMPTNSIPRDGLQARGDTLSFLDRNVEDRREKVREKYGEFGGCVGIPVPPGGRSSTGECE